MKIIIINLIEFSDVVKLYEKPKYNKKRILRTVFEFVCNYSLKDRTFDRFLDLRKDPENAGLLVDWILVDALYALPVKTYMTNNGEIAVLYNSKKQEYECYKVLPKEDLNLYVHNQLVTLKNTRTEATVKRFIK